MEIRTETTAMVFNRGMNSYNTHPVSCQNQDSGLDIQLSNIFNPQYFRNKNIKIQQVYTLGLVLPLSFTYSLLLLFEETWSLVSAFIPYLVLLLLLPGIHALNFVYPDFRLKTLLTRSPCLYNDTEQTYYQPGCLCKNTTKGTCFLGCNQPQNIPSDIK